MWEARIRAVMGSMRMPQRPVIKTASCGGDRQWLGSRPQNEEKPASELAANKSFWAQQPQYRQRSVLILITGWRVPAPGGADGQKPSACSRIEGLASDSDNKVGVEAGEPLSLRNMMNFAPSSPQTFGGSLI